MNVGQIFVELGLKDGSFKAGLKGAESQAKGFGNTLKGSLATGAAMAASTIGFQGIGAAMKGTIGAGLGMNSQLEQNQVAFQVLMGDADKASKVIKNLYQYAATTPFEFPDIANAARTLQTVGLEGDKVIKWVGDLAAANPQATIGEVASAIAKLKSGSFGEAFERLRDFGLSKPMLEGAGLKFDKSGQYTGSVDQAMKAVQGIVGKKYGGMADAQSKTFGGMVSTIKDSINMTLGSAFEPMFNDLKTRMPGIIKTLGGISDAFKTGGLKAALETIIPKGVVAQFIGIFGSLKGLWADFSSSFMGGDKGVKVDWAEEGRLALDNLKMTLDALKPAAAQAGQVLGAAWGIMRTAFSWLNVNLPRFLPILKAIGVGFLIFQTVAGIVGMLAGPVTFIIGLVSSLFAAFMTGGSVFGVLLAAIGGPVTLIIAAIAAIGAIGFLVWKNWDKIKAWLIMAWGAIKAAAVSVWNGISAFFQKWGSTILAVIMGPVAMIGLFIFKHWDQIKAVTMKVWNGIVAGLKAVWAGIVWAVKAYFGLYKTIIMGVWNGLKTASAAVWNGIKAAVTGVWSGIKSAATSAWGGIKSTVVNLWNSLVSTIKGKVSAFVAIGSAISNGIKQGLSNTWSALVSKLKGLTNLLPAAVKSLLGIRSPSRIFAGLGEQIPAGLAMGITGSAGVVKAAIGNMVDLATGTMGVGLNVGGMAPAMAGGSSSSSSVVLAAGAIQVNGAQNPRAVADEIMRELHRRGVL